MAPPADPLQSKRQDESHSVSYGVKGASHNGGTLMRIADKEREVTTDVDKARETTTEQGDKAREATTAQCDKASASFKDQDGMPSLGKVYADVHSNMLGCDESSADQLDGQSRHRERYNFRAV